MAAPKFLQLVSGIISSVTAAVVGGGGSANQMVATNSSGVLDVTFMPSGIGPNTQVITASEAISAGALVNVFNNAGSIGVRNADNSSVAKPANGFTLSAIASSASGTIYLSGIVTGLTGLTPGAAYYLGSVGGVVVVGSIPSASGTMVQQIGVALSATTLEFNPALQVNN